MSLTVWGADQLPVCRSCNVLRLWVEKSWAEAGIRSREVAMSDCQHEWDTEPIQPSGDQRVFACLKCGQRVVAGPLTSAMIKPEQRLSNEPVPRESAGIGPENHTSVTWDYESTYYHIYRQTPSLQGVIEPIIIAIPRTVQADADVQGIVDALNRIASRLGTEG